jgi:hypothetical protein
LQADDLAELGTGLLRGLGAGLSAED